MPLNMSFVIAFHYLFSALQTREGEIGRESKRGFYGNIRCIFYGIFGCLMWLEDVIFSSLDNCHFLRKVSKILLGFPAGQPSLSFPLRVFPEAGGSA
jgi:hypothetical protein